jgi:hypothetical protein
MKWMNNTNGKPDSMLTFAFIAFSVVTLNILLATFGRIKFGSFELGLQSMEAATMTAYLGATFTAYVTRRWTEKRYDESGSSEGKDDE